MNRIYIAVRKTAIAAALISMGFAVPAWAQGYSRGVQSPSSSNELGPRNGPLPGKESTSIIPDKAIPRSDAEVGPQDLAEHSTTTTPPLGSATAPNPQTPKSTNETGGTAGSTDMGIIKRRSDDTR